MLHLWCCYHLVVVEPIAGEAHDIFVHPILDTQQRHHLRFLFRNALHQRTSQSTLQGLITFHRGWQLTMVTSQDDTTCPADGYPTSCLESLGCLIDEERAKLHAVEQTIG